MAEYVYPVPPECDGQTMQTFLRQHCGLSWRMVVKLKRVEGGMTADGCPLRSIDRLRAGQTVRVRMPEDAVRIEGADMPLDVVYEDADLLVINKPPYLAMHPSAGKPEPTLANAVVGYFAPPGHAAVLSAGQPAGPQYQRPAAGGQKPPCGVCHGHRSRRRCTWPLWLAHWPGKG